MPESQPVEFIAEDGSVVRACDFGPGYEYRYLTLPDLDPIEPTDREGVYFIRSLNLRVVRTDQKPSLSPFTP
jgi:hypothetical protein